MLSELKRAFELGLCGRLFRKPIISSMKIVHNRKFVPQFSKTGLFSIGDVDILARMTRFLERGAHNTLARDNFLKTVRAPASHASACKHRREQFAWNAQRGIHAATVEVDIRANIFALASLGEQLRRQALDNLKQAEFRFVLGTLTKRFRRHCAAETTQRGRKVYTHPRGRA